LTAARIEPVTQLFEDERASIELFTPSFLTLCRAVWKQLTCIIETEAWAVSCDVIIVTSHFESFGSILGHFPTFATPSAPYQWSCLGIPYRAVGCILYRSVTHCIPRCNVRSQQPVRQRLVERDNEREVHIPGPGHVERKYTPRAVTTHNAESKTLAYKKRKLLIATIEVVPLPPPCNVPAQMTNPTAERPSACMGPEGEKGPPDNSNQTREFATSSSRLRRRNHQRNEQRKITQNIIIN